MALGRTGEKKDWVGAVSIHELFFPLCPVPAILKPGQQEQSREVKVQAGAVQRGKVQAGAVQGTTKEQIEWKLMLKQPTQSFGVIVCVTINVV